MAGPQPIPILSVFPHLLSLAVEEVLKEKSVVEGALKDSIAIRTLLLDDNPAVIVRDALNIRHRADEIGRAHV